MRPPSLVETDDDYEAQHRGSFEPKSTRGAKRGREDADVDPSI